MSKILLINNNLKIYDNLQNRLKTEEHTCILCNAEIAPILVEEINADLVIIFCENQEKDMELFTKLKAVKKNILVIVKGVNRKAEDKIKWFEKGVWDCIDVDCSEGELLARIHAALRRLKRA